MSKVFSAADAVKLIPDNAAVWVVSSGGGINEPHYFLSQLEQCFLESGHPSSLTLCHSTGFGDRNGGGADRFAHPGMIRKVIGGHWSWSPRICGMAENNEIEAYTLPQGVFVQLCRAMAGRRPGVVTHVGIGTFIDPRIEGCGLNQRSKDELVRVMKIDDQDYLFYRSLPIDIAVIRGTTADEDGNISFEHEGVILEGVSAAQAARNNGGTVIVQVKRIVKRGEIKATDVRIPGILVDAIVVDPDQRHSYKTQFNPAFTGQYPSSEIQRQPMPQNVRTLIARRAAQELKSGACINLGFGVPTGIANVALSENIYDRLHLTVEQGVIGGIPAVDFDFSMAWYPMAIIEEAYQFDWYDGGGLDIAFLAFAEFDKSGNVNVGRFGNRITGHGPGGFINISQNAKKIVFMGTLCAVGFQVSVHDYRIHIQEQGHKRKAVNHVNQICFSGEQALKHQKEVLYITERAVFDLTPGGVRLIEIAPGADLIKDVLQCMDFKPLYDTATIRTMDPVLFSGDPLDLIKRFEN